MPKVPVGVEVFANGGKEGGERGRLILNPGFISRSANLLSNYSFPKVWVASSERDGTDWSRGGRLWVGIHLTPVKILRVIFAFEKPQLCKITMNFTIQTFKDGDFFFNAFFIDFMRLVVFSFYIWYFITHVCKISNFHEKYSIYVLL